MTTRRSLGRKEKPTFAEAVENLADALITYLPLDPPPSPQLTETPTPLVDVAGFPLPVRSFYLSLDWTY